MQGGYHLFDQAKNGNRGYSVTSPGKKQRRLDVKGPERGGNSEKGIGIQGLPDISTHCGRKLVCASSIHA